MIEYNSRLNNFFGVRVVPLLTQITAPIKQEKKFSINISGKFHELCPVCEKCGCNRIDHNGNDLYKNKLIKELGVVIKRGKFICKNAGTHGLQNAKMLNFLFNNIRKLSEQKYSIFAHLMFHWIILMYISKECLVKR